MKKNNTSKLVVFALLITLIAVILVCSTYAKYVTDATGSDTATVAKWSIKVGDTDITTATGDLSFNIFNTIKNDDGNDENNVSKTDGTLIAPGTMGSFKIALQNDSEVTASCKVTYSIDNTDIPLVFSTDEGDSKTWKSLSELNQSITAENIAAGASGNTTPIYWKWAFNNGKDTKDTTLGKTAPEVKVTATIHAEQVN